MIVRKLSANAKIMVPNACKMKDEETENFLPNLSATIPVGISQMKTVTKNATSTSVISGSVRPLSCK